MINNFDKKITGEIEEVKVENRRQKIKYTKPEQNNNSTSNSQNNNFNFINKKHQRKTKEEIIKEKEDKIQQRQKTFRKLNKKTRKGQPVMKYKIEHLFNKIRNKFGKEEN
jgi:hypothetical protein